MKTIMDKINEFESNSTQTVSQFNKLFPFAKLENLADGLEVEIGEIVDTDTTRYILVGGLVVKHSFENKYSYDILMEENEEEF